MHSGVRSVTGGGDMHRAVIEVYAITAVTGATMGVTYVGVISISPSSIYYGVWGYALRNPGFLTEVSGSMAEFITGGHMGTAAVVTTGAAAGIRAASYEGIEYLDDFQRLGAKVFDGGGGLNLFRWKAPQTGETLGWKVGDFMLHLPNQGTPKLNWKANFGALRR